MQLTCKPFRARRWRFCRQNPKRTADISCGTPHSSRRCRATSNSDRVSCSSPSRTTRFSYRKCPPTSYRPPCVSPSTISTSSSSTIFSTKPVGPNRRFWRVAAWRRTNAVWSDGKGHTAQDPSISKTAIGIDVSRSVILAPIDFDRPALPWRNSRLCRANAPAWRPWSVAGRFWHPGCVAYRQARPTERCCGLFPVLWRRILGFLRERRLFWNL